MTLRPCDGNGSLSSGKVLVLGSTVNASMGLRVSLRQSGKRFAPIVFPGLKSWAKAAAENHRLAACRPSGTLFGSRKGY